MLTLLQRAIIFPRGFAPRAEPDAAPPAPGDRLWIDTPEGRVEAWFLPGADVSATRPGPLLVYAHGNAEIIDLWPPNVAPYHRLGVSVLLPEYRGYGRSAGRPSQAAIGEDVLRFHDLALARPEVDRGRVVLHGRSLGGGVVCDLALRRPPAALILQSTFTSMRAMARRYLLPGFLVRDPFDNLAAVKQLRAPLLIVHGRQDDLIPFGHAEALHAAAAGSRFFAVDGLHNDPLMDRAAYWEEITRFLRQAGVLR